MEKPLMYRKRYIPDEIKSLNDDEILFINDEVIVTRWKTFKPKKEFSNGISYTFLNRGYKNQQVYERQRRNGILLLRYY